MVYCGKPSTSCHACRERKTRCDAKPLQVGGCTQCFGAGRKCPGYRVQVDLIFRDQSQNVARKVKARAEKASHVADRGERVNDTADEQLEIIQRRPFGQICSLNPSLEERATCYFVSNHHVGITIPAYGDCNGETTSHIWKIIDPTLGASMKAASLASFAQHVQSSELFHTSRHHYTQAIQLTNTALSSPTDATKDSTLLSIILLGLYEVLTGRDPTSLQYWAQHAQGAAGLLKLRGREQFQTTIGRRMFLQATGSVLGACMRSCVRLPEHIMEMMRELASVMNGMSENARLGLMVFQASLDFNQFRCDISDGTISDPQALVDRALELDASLVYVCNNHPPEWRFETFYQPDLSQDIVFNGIYHVYSDPSVPGLWNSVRMIRLMIHERIRDNLLQGFAAIPPTFTAPQHFVQLQQSTNIIYEMQSGVFASVPQSLGYISKVTVANESPPPVYGDSPNAPTLTHKVNTSPTGASNGSYILLWPLFIAGVTALATQDAEIYCGKSLRKLGNVKGLQQALVLADVIENKAKRHSFSPLPGAQ